MLDACNSVIEFAAERFTKNLRSERKSKQRPFLTTVADDTDQARYVAQQILDAREDDLSSGKLGELLLGHDSRVSGRLWFRLFFHFAGGHLGKSEALLGHCEVIGAG